MVRDKRVRGERHTLGSSSGSPMTTYQTRIRDYGGMERSAGDAALSAYAELYGRVERKLFAEVAAGRNAASLKSEYLKRYGIPARMFNSIRVSLEGKVASVREQQKLRLDSLGRRITRAQRQIAGAAEHGRWDQVHQKRRRLATLQSRLAALEANIAQGRVRLCFGSKRLWQKQHHLEQNGYVNHQEWLADWQDARRDEFFVLGSRDETAGCQLCAATVADDGTLTLRLRMPDCLAGQHGKYVIIAGVRFAHGHEQVLAALQSNAEYARYRREHGEKAARASELGQAISHRFKRDKKGWRVFATTQMMDVPVVTDKRRGAVGVDLNADHLAVCETDASGNPVHAFSVPLVTYGKSAHQAEAIIGDAVASVVAYARDAGKPIVMERLDFRQKKAVLEGESRKYSRMLSSFSYGKIKACFISRGYRQGVEVHQVNPAFSSVIGRVKFMERYGLSVHQAAALVLARRLLGCSERIPRRRVCPVGNGVHVAFTVPARKRMKHVWTYWGEISSQLRPALAAQRRLVRQQRRANPVSAVTEAQAHVTAGMGTSSSFPGESPGRSRLALLGRRSALGGSSEVVDGPLRLKLTTFTTAHRSNTRTRPSALSMVNREALVEYRCAPTRMSVIADSCWNSPGPGHPASVQDNPVAVNDPPSAL